MTAKLILPMFNGFIDIHHLARKCGAGVSIPTMGLSNRAAIRVWQTEAETRTDGEVRPYSAADRPASCWAVYS